MSKAGRFPKRMTSHTPPGTTKLGNGTWLEASTASRRCVVSRSGLPGPTRTKEQMSNKKGRTSHLNQPTKGLGQEAKLEEPSLEGKVRDGVGVLHDAENVESSPATKPEPKNVPQEFKHR